MFRDILFASLRIRLSFTKILLTNKLFNETNNLIENIHDGTRELHVKIVSTISNSIHRHFIFFGGLTFAQSTGSIGGTVTDSGGAVVPNASIGVQSQGTGETHLTRTDSAGIYLVPSLPVGTYRIEVKSPGMQTTVASGVELSVGSALRQDFSLRVGSASETVEVSGAAPLIDSSSASLGSVVDHHTVQEIPLNGRHSLTSPC